MTSDPVLFDTNILVFSHNKDSDHYEKAKKLRDQVVEGKINGVLTIQNLLEFYAVVTSPKRIPLPLSPKQAIFELNNYLKSSFTFIHPHIETFEIALELLKKTPLRGGKIFDLYLVATMISAGTFTIFTDNDKDFSQFKGITVKNPFK